MPTKMVISLKVRKTTVGEGVEKLDSFRTASGNV